MGKKKDKKSDSKATENAPPARQSILAQHGEIDPALASLFASGAGLSKPMSTAFTARKDMPSNQHEAAKSNKRAGAEVDVDAQLPVRANIAGDVLQMEEDAEEAESVRIAKPRKRKRRDEDENLEAAYLDRLHHGEQRDLASRQIDAGKRTKLMEDEGGKEPSLRRVLDEDGGEEFEIPKHECVAEDQENIDLEKTGRTVFLGNVSIEAISSKAAKKTLLRHMSSIFPDLPAHTPPHKIESIRFRSTAFSNKLPKKASFVKKELMETTTKSTNAYVVYNTRSAANGAARLLNGTVVLDRHLRVDHVAHPQKVDHKRCVFVGNLDFVDDDSAIQEAEEGRRKKKKKEPGDVEEGLWRQFSQAGTVESVRVVRDTKTRVGKGFAYVQFSDEIGIEAALLFDGKSYPPLLPRKLRVVRARSMKRNAQKLATQRPGRDSDARSKPAGGAGSDRSRKLLGKAAAAQFSSIKSPASFVFEGHRASSAQGTRGLRLAGSGRKKDKPRTRSSKRASAWRAAGGVARRTKA